MNLNEAYRYSNYISNLINEIRVMLMSPDYTTQTTVIHHKAGAVPGCEDVTEVEKPRRRYALSNPDKAMAFLISLFDEKSNVAYAIEHAKDTNMDADLSLNKMRRELGVLFSNLASAEDGIVGFGNEYCYGLNADGDPNQYAYRTERTTTLRYNSEAARAFSKTLMKEADAVSSKLDEARLLCHVNFHPTYDVNDTLEEAYKKYADELVSISENETPSAAE